MKIVRTFQLKIVIFTAMKNRCILHGCVFVMYFEKAVVQLSDIKVNGRFVAFTISLSLVYSIPWTGVLCSEYKIKDQ